MMHLALLIAELIFPQQNLSQQALQRRASGVHFPGHGQVHRYGRLLRHV